MKPIKIFLKLIETPCIFFRMLLGPRNVCIYPVDCPAYAKWILENKPFLIAIFSIFFRVLSCNPLTALIWHIKFKRKL